MEITKLLVYLKEEFLHKTILDDHQTNKDNNILKKVFTRQFKNMVLGK
jgi:hypothetical protein